jgi:rSAM/selenodomain-associated transferase 1
MPARAHDTILLFARHPVAGRVKTRLSPALPPALAAALYNALLADTLAAVAAAGAARRELWWADEASADALTVAVPPDFAQRQQGAGDLGARLSQASAAALTEPDARVALIGSDAPALTAAHLDAAFTALDAHDVVLGPATDGGYWLIALRRPAPELFADMAWSTPQVLQATRTRAERAGLSVATLDTLGDLDTPADFARLLGRVAARRRGACGAHLLAELMSLGAGAAS